MPTAHSIAHASRFVTTAIPYVNGDPHVGFALEIVQADVLARFYRLAGDDVRFLTGTDENSLKNVLAAERAGLPVAALVESNSARFRALRDSLGLSFDDFIRTSTDLRHRPGVERLWAACAENGDVYTRAYRGLYCTGCEQFYRPDDFPDGVCPEHNAALETVEEENWFFRLSRYRDPLREIYERGEIDVVPAHRRNEVLAWIDAGLDDFSISRSATRAHGWGIPVPGDPGQVIYVWFDALANYITALGYGSDEALLSRYWTSAASREHVVGKGGVTRFHTLYWPAILLSAGVPLPTRIFVHGYVTVDGRKIGKSSGNAVDPVPLTAEFGADALRYVLLRHIRASGDGDFSVERLRQAYDSELAGQLGNLAHRVLSMIERYCHGLIPAPPPRYVDEDRLIAAASALPAVVAEYLRAYAFDRALDAIWTLVAAANRYVTEQEPWAAAKAAGSPDAAGDAAECRLHGTLFSLAAALVTIAQCLAPLLPDTSRGLLDKLGGGGAVAGQRVAVGVPLFPKR